MPYLLGHDQFHGKQMSWDRYYDELSEYQNEHVTKLGQHTGEPNPDLGIIRYKQLEDPYSPTVETLHDILTGPTPYSVFFSAKVRAIIEQMDPVSHYYAPIELNTLDGGVHENYFEFSIGDFVDALDDVNSDVDVVRSEKTGKKYRYGVGRRAKLFWRKSALGGRHIWVDRYHLRGLFISDELHARFVAEGIKEYGDVRSEYAVVH